MKTLYIIFKFNLVKSSYQLIGLHSYFNLHVNKIVCYEYFIFFQMDEQEVQASKVATAFINFMDNPEDQLLYDLSEDAVLDWFGRSILGRKAIVRFTRTQFLRIQHTIDNVHIVPAISHRLLRRFTSDIVYPSDKVVIECGERICQVTPENKVHPNKKELVKAPRKRRHRQCSANVRHWQFVELKGTVKFDCNGDSVEHFAEKKIQRIILGYSDQIHFIAYEAKSNCRKKLSLYNTSE